MPHPGVVWLNFCLSLANIIRPTVSLMLDSHLSFEGVRMRCLNTESRVKICLSNTNYFCHQRFSTHPLALCSAATSCAMCGCATSLGNAPRARPYACWHTRSPRCIGPLRGQHRQQDGQASARVVHNQQAPQLFWKKAYAPQLNGQRHRCCLQHVLHFGTPMVHCSILTLTWYIPVRAFDFDPNMQCKS